MIQSASDKKRLLLIDGSGFIFRAYHSLPPLTNGNGTPVGAVYGFVNMLQKLLGGKDVQATHAAVIFDAARKTFRNNIYPDYKAHRPPVPEDLIPQFPIIKEAAEALSLPCIELPDFEADDIIATYTKQAKDAGMDVVIVSSDKDLMQLVDDGSSTGEGQVVMYDAMKDKLIDEAQVFAKFGVAPDKVVDVQALIGDSSDNIPGISGIGVKGAAQLINEYGSLEALLEHAGEIKQPKRRANLIEGADIARISKELVTLRNDCAGIPPIDNLILKPIEASALLPFLDKHGFTSLYNRMANKLNGISGTSFKLDKENSKKQYQNSDSAISKQVSYETVYTESDLQCWIDKAYKTGIVAFDTETTGLNAMEDDIVGFSMAVSAGEACYVPLGHVVLEKQQQIESEKKTQYDLFGNKLEEEDEGGSSRSKPVRPSVASEEKWSRDKKQLDMRLALAMIKPLLEDDSVLKVGHNIKFDILVMKVAGDNYLGTGKTINISPVADTMLLSYVLSAGKRKQSMDSLAKAELGISTTKFSDIVGKGKAQIPFSKVPIDDATKYAAEDADVTLRLYETLRPQLAGSGGLMSLYERIERPLINVISGMEYMGIKLDKLKLAEFAKQLDKKLADIAAQIYKITGVEFNIASPKQLGIVLFEEMGLRISSKNGSGSNTKTPKKSSKTGSYITGVEILEELVEEGGIAKDVAEKVLQWRQLSKLRGTYTDTLIKQINNRTGRIHTSFSMAVTSTGRLSSSDPNLQNIPIRTAEGRKIREAFIAEEGFYLMSVDYSQIELRLLAHVADIASLKTSFERGEDIHSATASQIFGVPIGEVDADLRRKAKTINFGIIYGISAHGLATRLGIDRGDAAEYIKAYFAQYPEIYDYMESRKEEARRKGYVETIFGRRCYIRGINDKNGNVRAFAERAAINAPLQGAAADIIKKAMVDIDRLLIERKLESRMLLQVHDELIFEVSEQEKAWLPDLVCKRMENVVSLSVPLKVDYGIGVHWGEIH